MKVGFENFGETVSPSDFAIVTWTHAYSFSRIDSLLFWTEDDEYESWFWKDCESSLYCWDSSMDCILFSSSKFSSISCHRKGVLKYDVERFVEIVER